ncbi:MAG: hypothetical protein PQJ50_10405 [Spirochaetales bacterium]|nr:hypothetical protein [Spirochaetales bacterium]
MIFFEDKIIYIERVAKIFSLIVVGISSVIITAVFASKESRDEDYRLVNTAVNMITSNDDILINTGSNLLFEKLEIQDALNKLYGSINEDKIDNVCMVLSNIDQENLKFVIDDVEFLYQSEKEKIARIDLDNGKSLNSLKLDHNKYITSVKDQEDFNEFNINSYRRYTDSIEVIDSRAIQLQSVPANLNRNRPLRISNQIDIIPSLVDDSNLCCVTYEIIKEQIAFCLYLDDENIHHFFIVNIQGSDKDHAYVQTLFPDG